MSFKQSSESFSREAEKGGAAKNVRVLETACQSYFSL